MKYIDIRLGANIVNLEDANNNYVSENVEGALEEIDSRIKDIEANAYDDTQIKQEINNIKTEIGTEELTTTDQTIKGAVNEIDSRIKDVTNIADDTINIKQFPRLSSETSDTGRIKRAINYCIDAIKDGYTNVKIIEFGSGRYDIAETITIPVFVKIKSKGNVVFNSKVKGTLFKLYTPSDVSLPPSSNDIFTFNRGAWLDGAITIKLDDSISTVDTIAIEIGNTVGDAPDHRYYTGWYSLNDIFITGFQIGIKFNSYDNFLGKFDRIIVRRCEKGLLFNGTTVKNSGESFAFNDSIFCNSDVCCYISSWKDLELVFNGCSFDFNSRCIETSTEDVVRLSNCHFEGIGFEDNGSEKGDDNSCIVLSKGNSFNAPNIFVSGSDIMSARDTLFKSVNKNGMNLLIEGLTTKGSKGVNRLYALCDDNVDISVNNFVPSMYLSMITQRKLNRKINSNFENIENQAITNGMVIEGYTFESGDFTGRAMITDEKFFKNGKSLKLTVPAGGQWCKIFSEEFECKPGDKILNNFYWFTETSGTKKLGRMSIETYFYDKDGNTLTYPATKIDGGTILNSSTNNEWNRFKQMEYVVAPQNSKKCKIAYIINPVDECTLYLTEFYTSIY